MNRITRREAIKRLSAFLGSAVLMNGCTFDIEDATGVADVTGIPGAMAGSYHRNETLFSSQKPVVSISKIPPRKDLKNGTEYAVREAIDLLAA